jgi:hypothetical protein
MPISLVAAQSHKAMSTNQILYFIIYSVYKKGKIGSCYVVMETTCYMSVTKQTKNVAFYINWTKVANEGRACNSTAYDF